MPIQEKLNDDDLALIEVLEDPIWFAEFLRSTRDASHVQSAWPKEEFAYRWYQRDLITDTTEHIVLTGGRAIGKCQPLGSKLYTTKGYRTIYTLIRENNGTCELPCLDEHGNFTTRRAVIVKDRWTRIYEVTTKSGYKVKGSDNHPILTQDGYVMIGDLDPKKHKSVVVTRLPWHSTQNLWRYCELRYLGYRFFDTRWYPEVEFRGRFKAIEQDYKRIAEEMGAIWAYQNGAIVSMRPGGSLQKHPIRYATMQLGWDRIFKSSNTYKYARLVPHTLMQERVENIKIFLEAIVAQYAELNSTKEVRLDCKYERTATLLQELFLRCGVEMVIEGTVLRTYDDIAAYRLYSEFDLPGVSVNVNPPLTKHKSTDTRYDEIVSVECVQERALTYAVYVYDYHNYISDGLVVHNSLVLEDKQLFNIFNQDTMYPETKEMLLTTANKAQIEPVLGRLITRATTSPLFRDFLQNRVNRSDGIMDFRFNGIQFLHRSRIAGGNKESNIVGIHVPDILIDEGQLYLSSAFTQLMPTMNSWEARIQMFIAGVSNGVRNSALYITSVKMPRFKWYRVPSPNNPYVTKEDYLDALRRYGGEDSDEFLQLFLGKHGTAALSVISRDQIPQKPYDFYNYRYQDADTRKGQTFQQILDRPLLAGYDMLIAGIDTGFSDPTIIGIFGSQKGVWRHLVRYKLQRIMFPEQEQIINWLDDFYKFDKIAIDIGSGGGGPTIVQSLCYRDEYRHKDYIGRILPVQFGEKVTVGYSTEGQELGVTAKALGAQNMVMMFQQGTLELSEIDNECISQMERITKQRTTLGDDQYFIMSDKGNGKALDDHIFSSFICFAMAVRDTSFMKRKRKKLGKAGGKSS